MGWWVAAAVAAAAAAAGTGFASLRRYGSGGRKACRLRDQGLILTDVPR